MRSIRAFVHCLAGCVLAIPLASRAATTAYQDLIAQGDPVLYYQFNEASGAALNYGSLGNGYDATYLGTPTRNAVTRIGDSGVAFDTNDDYLQSLGVAPAGLTGNPTFSAEVLFFIPSDGVCGLWAPFLHWGPSAAETTAKSVYFSFSQNDPTAAFAGFYNGGLKSPTGALPRGRWHHYIWVRSGGGNALTGTTVYLDGIDVTASLVEDPALPVNNLTPSVGATEFRVNRARDFESQRYFTGTIDELALYTRALTAQEALDHFHEAIIDIFKDSFE